MALAAAAETSPMGEINMTPLIDVMLVLLVMFIITIPLQTHAVKLNLPAKCEGCPDVQALKNKLTITNGGAIFFNDKSVSRDELRITFSMKLRGSSQSLNFTSSPSPKHVSSWSTKFSP